MSVKSFKFISPGIFINEIDNSQLPTIPDEIGPVIIGRTERGPSMRPVKVSSFSEYVQIFGNPIPGGQGGDVWRDGNYTAPTYAAYAAQAYLRNSNAVTMVRLLGAQKTGISSTSGGRAGWETSGSNDTDAGNNGGAYGLFVFPSASTTTAVTGTLAAVWYLDEGTIELSGTLRGSAPLNSQVTGTAFLAEDLSQSGVSGAGSHEYKVLIKDDEGNLKHETAFNFTRSSNKYIRKVFNTNPTLINTNCTRGPQTASYWLGPSYERSLTHYVTTANSYGVILGLDSGSNSAANFRFGFQAAQTPWIISQHLQSSFAGFVADSMTKLFKFHALDSGEDVQKSIKVSISGIKRSTNEHDPFGSFNVEIRDLKDSDNSPVILERFNNCNLNPASPNYLARRVGDQFLSWDDLERRHRVYGNYLNNSSYIRVEMNEDVDAAATDARLLPFGSFGPVRFKKWGQFLSGGAWGGNETPEDTYVTGAIGIAMPFTGSFVRQDQFMMVGTGSVELNTAFTGTVRYPKIPLRTSASAGDLPDPKKAYFGMDTTQQGNNRYEDSTQDILRALPFTANSFTIGAGTEFSYVFTLDDLSASNDGGAAGEEAVYTSGSRNGGTSFTAKSGSYEQVLDMGYNRFTVPIYGGFDGVDITEKEPFNNTRLGDSDSAAYEYYSVRRAIDTVADPEVAEYNLMAIPGIFKESITAHAIEVCESRGDALAVIDIDSGYKAQTENTESQETNAGSVKTAVTNMRNRGLNSSYGAAYYPWVQIRDTISDSLLFVPPSVVALGTYSSSQRKSELWFAPAGFNRGGLTEGSAGVPVIQTRTRLTSGDRDDLYEANINPIATFPSEGIVIFGQKTLQVTPSALDRINVRRLMIFVKKRISQIAAGLLFDPNVKTTWARFTSQVNPFLADVKTNFGLSDYRVVLDDTTTTPDLIDRNILYAKIFLKPTRAIEFIAIDFNITRTGASFDD